MKYDYEPRDALKKIDYPSLDSNGPLSYKNATPIRVLYQLPPYLYVRQNDKIRVAAFDVVDIKITEFIK